MELFSLIESLVEQLLQRSARSGCRKFQSNLRARPLNIVLCVYDMPLISAQFEYSEDELLDVQLRCLHYLKISFWGRWRDLLLMGFCGAVIAHTLLPLSATGKVIGGLVLGLLMACGYAVIYRIRYIRHLRKMCVTQLKGQQNGLFQIELRDDGYWTKQPDLERTFLWDDVKLVTKTPETIDIVNHNGDLTVVRKRAFETDASYQQFIAFIETHLPKGTVC